MATDAPKPSLSDEQSNLCETCEAITIYIPRKTIPFHGFQGSRQLLRSYTTLLDLQAGAASRCQFCILLNACHQRSVGEDPTTHCTNLVVYRIVLDAARRRYFIKLECIHAYGRHSEHCLALSPCIEGTRLFLTEICLLYDK